MTQRSIDAYNLASWLEVMIKQTSKDEHGKGYADALDTVMVGVGVGRFDLAVKPGDKIKYTGWQFPFLNGEKIDNIQIHKGGIYAAIVHEGERYTIPLAHCTRWEDI